MECGPRLPLGISSVFTKRFCVPLSSELRVSTSAPSITHACVFLVKLRQDNLVHLSVTSQLTHSDQDSSVVHRNAGRQCFRRPALATFGEALDLHADIGSLNQICDQLQHHDHVTAFPSRRTVCREDYLVIGCVSSLQREQTICFTLTVRHSAGTTPPSTHAVFRCLFLFTMVSANPPQEIFHWEQLAMLTDTCQRDGSSSFLFRLQGASRSLYFST